MWHDLCIFCKLYYIYFNRFLLLLCCVNAFNKVTTPIIKKKIPLYHLLNPSAIKKTNKERTIKIVAIEKYIFDLFLSVIFYPLIGALFKFILNFFQYFFNFYMSFFLFDLKHENLKCYWNKNYNDYCYASHSILLLFSYGIGFLQIYYNCQITKYIITFQSALNQ